MSLFTRRDFNRSVLAGAVGLFAPAFLRAAETFAPISVSTWSFHNYFPNTRYGQPKFTLEDWKLQNVVRRAKDKLGITAFEISSAHLASFEPAYLEELSGFAKEQKCKLIHLSDNFKGVNLARADKDKREADVKTFEQLVGVAQKLGIPTMRVNTGTPEAKDWDLQITIDVYKRLAKFAKERGVEIVIENHFGLSADPRNVARIIEAVGDNISSCPDFGLFKSEERWSGMEIMLKHCKRIVSAKFHGLGDKGEHKDFDLKRCYDMLRDAKFRGLVSLEYEGPLEPTPQLERMNALAMEWMK
ncbi:MAG: sugar phosphate isomerase/epimerase [Gemmataceae bacterium]|nr:sugar phosphate isomerase/epimerase [Gemmataceae bacterium]